METWDRLIAVGGEDGVVEWRKEGQRTSHGTPMNDAWTWTMERRLLWERRVG